MICLSYCELCSYIDLFIYVCHLFMRRLLCFYRKKNKTLNTLNINTLTKKMRIGTKHRILKRWNIFSVLRDIFIKNFHILVIRLMKIKTIPVRMATINKKKWQKMLVRIWGKESTFLLLVWEQTCRDILGISVKIPQKAESQSTITSNHTTLRNTYKGL